jgi:hypothetical protein
MRAPSTLRRLMLAAAAVIAVGGATLPMVSYAGGPETTGSGDERGAMQARGYDGGSVGHAATGHIGSIAFTGRGIGRDFAGYGLDGTSHGISDSGFVRDHLHRHDHSTLLGYYDGFSSGEDCALLDREFGHRPAVCE